MLYEYAVEPQAISIDWQTCRYLAEKFGFDRGRLLALFPKKWLPIAIDASSHLSDVEKKRVVEKLVELKRASSVRTGRAYNDEIGSWLHNALAQHAIDPFRAIIATDNPEAAVEVLTLDDVEETHPLIKIDHDAAIVRDAAILAGTMGLLLRTAKRILFIDGYYDPFNARYQDTLRECLMEVYKGNPAAICEIHHRDHGKCPPVKAIEGNAKEKFAKVIPNGMAVTIFRWREKNGGPDFHARYLLTEKGGIGIDAGFSAEGSHQTTDMHLMSVELAQKKLKAFDKDAADYELIEPVLQIASDGSVKHT